MIQAAKSKIYCFLGMTFLKSSKMSNLPYRNILKKNLPLPIFSFYFAFQSAFV
jgi:hypothetical protein